MHHHPRLASTRGRKNPTLRLKFTFGFSAPRILARATNLKKRGQNPSLHSKSLPDLLHDPPARNLGRRFVVASPICGYHKSASRTGPDLLTRQEIGFASRNRQVYIPRSCPRFLDASRNRRRIKKSPSLHSHFLHLFLHTCKNVQKSEVPKVRM